MDLLQKEIARKRKELEEANLMVLYILMISQAQTLSIRYLSTSCKITLKLKEYPTFNSLSSICMKPLGLSKIK